MLLHPASADIGQLTDLQPRPVMIPYRPPARSSSDMPGGFPGVNWNVRLRVYCAVMSQYILSADAPRPLRRFTVTVTLPRPDGEDVLMPPGAQAAAERAAAAVAADGLLTAWTSARAVLSMVIEAPCQADALTAGAAVVRALGGERGAAVKAEPAIPG